MNVGYVTKKIRENLGLSQENIANMLGVSNSTYRRYEKSQVSDAKKSVICREISYKIAEFIYEDKFKDIIIKKLKDELLSGLDYKLKEYIKDFKIDSLEDLSSFIYEIYVLCLDKKNSSLDSDEKEVEIKYLSNSIIIALNKVINFLNPKSILEIGSNYNYGKFLKFVANNQTDLIVTALSSEQMYNLKVDNVEFVKKNDCFKVENSIQHDVVIMFYSFHHLLDENKEKFISNVYSKMKNKSYFILIDVFLPETYNELEVNSIMSKKWEARARETYYSEFWSCFGEMNLEECKRKAKLCYDKELEMFKKVCNRDDEYLISVTTLREIFLKANFEEVVGEALNTHGEAIYVYQKRNT